MQYNDGLYGTVEINEPVLLDLMASDAVQRTQGISQHGITALLGITPPFSRFDHCVGTMLLVRRLGGGVDEQVAALLHDVSHTAFSHVVDFVFDDHGRQSYHEEHKEAFVADSDIPAVLGRHDMDWRDVIDERHFPLLEQPSPALCADRLDYFLRDLQFLNLAGEIEIQAALASLRIVGHRIAVDDIAVARWLAYTFIEVDRASWSNFREVGLYQVTAEAIKAALRCELVNEADLWGSDQALWQRLRLAQQSDVRRWVDLINPATRFTWNEKQPVFRLSSKVRSIDPPVTVGDAATPLSALDGAFLRYRKDYLASKQGQWPMGIVAPPEATP